jgi:hypothetical protein
VVGAQSQGVRNYLQGSLVVEEDLSQGVPESVLKNKESQGKTSSGGRATRNIQREEPFKVSQNQ